MQGPGDQTAPPQRPAGATADRARRVGSAQLNVVPVDSMRLFVHWFVPAEQLRHALTQVRGEGAGARLRLRILDVLPGGQAALASEPRQELAAGGGWHEGFITLDRPGGSIVAALGIQDAHGAFSALLTSLVITLPDPAVPAAATTATPAKEQKIPQLGPARAQRARVLRSVSVARSRRGGAEPSLRKILARFTEPEKPAAADAAAATTKAPEAPPEQPAARPAPPEAERKHEDIARQATGDAIANKPDTVAVEERGADTSTSISRDPVAQPPAQAPAVPPEPPVAVSAAQAAAAAPEPPVAPPAEEETHAAPAPVSPASADDVSVSPAQETTPDGGEAGPERAEEEGGIAAATPDIPERFASFFDAAGERDSAFLQAELVASGRLGDGHRLWIGNEEVVPHSGGTFSYRKKLEGAPLAWAFLLHAASMDEDASVPSLELIASHAEAHVPLTMRVSIEIEGRLESASHRSLLPSGVEADDSGRFSFIRQLPAGAWFLPQLILTART
jgi:hypothetical protein